MPQKLKATLIDIPALHGAMQAAGEKHGGKEAATRKALLDLAGKASPSPIGYEFQYRLARQIVRLDVKAPTTKAGLSLAVNSYFWAFFVKNISRVIRKKASERSDDNS